jgi:hypothetical protein
MRSIAMLRQVLPERIEVRFDRPLDGAVGVKVKRVLSDSHGDLQKWDHQ